MAKNEPNKPEEAKTTSGNEAPAEEQTVSAIEPTEVVSNTPTPELTAEEAALREMGEEQLEPPTPFGIGGEPVPVPDPGDVVVVRDVFQIHQITIHLAFSTFMVNGID